MANGKPERPAKCTDEYKRNAVDYVISSGRPATEVAKELGIRGIAPNSKKRTAIPDEDAPARPDLIKRDLTSPVLTCKLVGDITYLGTREGWLYLAGVIDLCTRMVVGWAMSERMTAGIVVEALERAWRRGCVAGNAIFHSDSTPPRPWPSGRRAAG